MASGARVVASTHHTALKKFALESTYDAPTGRGGRDDRNGCDRGDDDNYCDDGGRDDGRGMNRRIVESPNSLDTIAYPAAMQWEGQGAEARPTYMIAYGTIGDARAFETAARLGTNEVGGLV